MSNMTVDTAKMEKAFELVCPAAHAKMLAAKGLITEQAARTVSWRDPIAALVLEAELAAAGVTVSDVAAAVEFYTATRATVTKETVARRDGDDAGPCDVGRPGFLVLAKGYRAGPAGDH